MVPCKARRGRDSSVGMTRLVRRALAKRLHRQHHSARQGGGAPGASSEGVHSHGLLIRELVGPDQDSLNPECAAPGLAISSVSTAVA